MTEYEDLLRQEAERRGWAIEVHQNRILVGEIPYRKKDGEAGRCQISVETQDDGVTMKAPENGGGAAHAARLSGVDKGCAYQATGEPVGNVLWTDNNGKCVISIKRDDGKYVNGWHALAVYNGKSRGMRLEEEEREQIERIFRFEIVGDDARDMQNWRDRARGQKIGIVGLGGVGLWILDLMSKTDVREIRIWGRRRDRRTGTLCEHLDGQVKMQLVRINPSTLERSTGECGQGLRFMDNTGTQTNLKTYLKV